MLSDIIKLLAVFKEPKKILHAGMVLLVLSFIGIILAVVVLSVLSFAWHLDPVVLVESGFQSALLGLKGFDTSSERLAGTRLDLLSKSKKEVFYVGAVFYRTLDENKREVISAIKRGVKVRFLIADPRGRYFDANAAFFGQSITKLKKEFDTTIDGYRDVKAGLGTDATYGLGSIELRVTDSVFPNAFYFYDPDSTDGHLVMVVRNFGRNAPEMPVFHLVKTNSGIMEAYFASAKEVWNQAKPFEEWEKATGG